MKQIFRKFSKKNFNDLKLPRSSKLITNERWKTFLKLMSFKKIERQKYDRKIISRVKKMMTFEKQILNVWKNF